MKILVVYYSKAQKTKAVAKIIAENLLADIEEISDLSGAKKKFLRNIINASKNVSTEIEPLRHSVKDYDVVVIASPIWAHHISTPINAFFTNYGKYINNYVIVVTRGNKKKNYKEVCDTLEKRLEKRPISFLSVCAGLIREQDFSTVRKFSKDLETQLRSIVQN